MSAPYGIRIYDENLIATIKKLAYEWDTTGPDVVARILLKSDDFLDALSAVRAQKAKRRSVGTTDSL